MVIVNFHGEAEKELGTNWELDVSSVAEAMRAIDINTKKLSKYFLKKYKEGVGYQILINGNEFITPEPLDHTKLETIKNSELMMQKKNLKTIDVIPVLEGAVEYVVALIIVIIVAVVTYVLAQPPNIDQFREIEQGGKTSYLFSGPENVTGEGGPVPLGYGRALVGSQVIAAAYVIREYQVTDTSRIVRDELGNLTLPPKPKITTEERTSRSRQRY